MIVDGEGMLALLEWHTRCRFEAAVGAAEAIGLNVRVISTFRSLEDQRILWEKWDACQEARASATALQAFAVCAGVLPADFPGESPHNFGMGIDAAPVCTDEFARYRESRSVTIATSTTESPLQGTIPGVGPLNVPIEVTCAAVPTSVLWAYWHLILKQHCLVVPLPQTDRPHSELDEFRELKRTGALT